MRTKGHELRSEAGIYAEGTDMHASDLVRWYNSYCDTVEEDGEDPDDFQRWFEREYPDDA